MIVVTANDRANVFKITHPAYAENVASWQIFLDAIDGQGGFLNGEYLDRYDRELENSFKTRKAAARYHNYSEALTNLYTRKIFSKPVQRSTSNEELTAWLANVDGAGTDMSAFVQRALTRALASGHVGALVDRTADAPTGPAKADEKSIVYLTQYLPTAIQDWRTKSDGTIVAVKLREGVGSTNLLEEHAEGDDAVQMLLWDNDSWVRVPHGADDQISSNTHGLGVVPFAVLTPKPLERWPIVGKALCGNANILKALFNRASEEDQVLRDQAFSVLTVDVPTDGDVEKTKSELGSDIGTTRAIVTHGTAKYITPDMNVPKAIRENISFLVQEIYRMAFIKATRESLQAESAEAIKLKQSELNDFLVSVADACQAFELRLIRFWCGWKSSNEAAAEKLFESLKLTVAYDRNFFLEDLGDDLKNWAMALKMDLGATMEKRVRMKAVHRLEPDLDDKEKKTVEQEIEAIANKPKPDPAALVQGLRSAAAARMPKPGQKPGDQQQPPAAGEGAAA